MAPAVDGVDHVLHLAAVIPPATDVDQTTAYAVNVGGTRQLVAAATVSGSVPGLTFTSTAQVYGDNDEHRPPRFVDEPVVPEDTYARQKVAAEELVRAHAGPWTICRLGMTPPLGRAPLDGFLFALHPRTRVQFTDPRDAADALVATVGERTLAGRVVNVAGAPANRTHYLEWLNRYLGVLGVPPLPSEAFGSRRFYTDWLDTDDGQAVLGYQQRSEDDFFAEVEAGFGPSLALVRSTGPLTRRLLLAHSPHLGRERRPVVAARRAVSRAAGARRATQPWLSDYLRHATGRAVSRRSPPARDGRPG